MSHFIHEKILLQWLLNLNNISETFHVNINVQLLKEVIYPIL